ncbi:MAG TPA: NosD domain-containing protein [Methanospirillum sp.]|uniref:NosD domain-containing protein n=1 Tax=Methanospirillum sp. TaxID=45200 RepID=UPI002CC4DC49|nr:NosD domain-containing protein [Methanospirillum sp.]HWQ62802.1 NosD domain-containing protein [Methanospirillum sp.]
MSRMGQISRGVILLVVMGALFGTMAAAQPIKAPAVITTPGVYELSGDAREITDIYGIQIQCSNVVIDGAGHFLGGEEREKSAGVFVNQYGGSITNVTVKNLNLENWESGIDYTYVKGQKGDSNLITKCDIVKCDVGIRVEYSDYVRVEENQLHDCSSGVVVEGLSTNTDLKKNTIKGCGQGISITNSQQTTIEENTINTCKVYGVEVTDSEGTIVKKNGISDNKYAALKIENSKESEINGNTLSQTEVGPVLIIGNDVHNAVITNNYFSSFENVLVDDVSTDISWNITRKPGTNILGGPYLGGNYWGSAAGGKGYSDSAADKDGFGIADKSYRINEYNIDYLPLTHTTATKAPEEQEITPDANVTNSTLDNTSSKTSEHETKPVSDSEQPSVSENISTVPHVKESLAPTPTEKQVEQKNVSNATNSTKFVNITNVTTLTPVLTINDSILNRSVANGYPAENSQILQVPSPVNNSHTVEVSENRNVSSQSGGLNTSSINQSSEKLNLPAQNGYLVFLASEAGGRVILTTTTGSEIKLDPMQQKNLTVPVPVGGLEYTSYRIEKDGYTPVSGSISPYPGSGQTTTITVTLTKHVSNVTSQSGPKPVQNGVKQSDSIYSATVPNTTGLSSPANTSVSSVNKTESATSSLAIRNQTSGVTNISTNQTATPVVHATQPPTAAVVVNGVNQTISSQSSHVIQASSGPGGSISPNGSVSVEDKGTSSFIVAADDYHKISYLVIDGIKTSPMSEYRFINVTTDHTIMAGFA